MNEQADMRVPISQTGELRAKISLLIQRAGPHQQTDPDGTGVSLDNPRLPELL